MKSSQRTKPPASCVLGLRIVREWTTDTQFVADLVRAILHVIKQRAECRASAASRDKNPEQGKRRDQNDGGEHKSIRAAVQDVRKRLRDQERVARAQQPKIDIRDRQGVEILEQTE